MAYGTLNAGTITPGSGNTLTINETVTHTGAVTLPSPVINTGVSGTAILDEDAMGTDSATQLATQQSIKAYVDSAASQATTAAQGVGTGNTPEFAGVKITATGGINFSAYATSGNPSSNLLDDYEEGTWTPTLEFGGATTGIVQSSTVGLYTKIGNVVHITGQIGLSNKGSATGSAKISGLPFAEITFAPHVASSFVSVTFANVPFMDISGSTFRLWEVTEAGTQSTLTNGNFSNSSSTKFSATYQMA
jgi:hypothetical protein